MTDREVTCQSKQAAGPHILCSHTSLSPFKLWSRPVWWGPHDPGTTNKETMFLCRLVSVNFSPSFFLQITLSSLSITPILLQFPIWKSVVSAKCKVLWNVIQEVERWGGTVWESLGSSWQHSHNAVWEFLPVLPYSQITLRSPQRKNHFKMLQIKGKPEEVNGWRC